MKSDLQRTIHSFRMQLTEKERSENEKVSQLERLKKENFAEVLERKKAMTTLEAREREYSTLV